MNPLEHEDFIIHFILYKKLEEDYIRIIFSELYNIFYMSISYNNNQEIYVLKQEKNFIADSNYNFLGIINNSDVVYDTNKLNYEISVWYNKECSNPFLFKIERQNYIDFFQGKLINDN